MDFVHAMMQTVLILLLLCGLCSADYECLCSYDVEKPVLDSSANSSQTIGYMYEFDCKPLSHINGIDIHEWRAIAFEHKLGYVKMDPQLQVQICPGDPSPADLLATKSLPFTTSATKTTLPITGTKTQQSLTTSVESTTSQATIRSTTTKPTTQTSHRIQTKPKPNPTSSATVTSTPTIKSSTVSQSLAKATTRPIMTTRATATVTLSSSTSTTSFRPTSTSTKSKTTIPPTTSSTSQSTTSTTTKSTTSTQISQSTTATSTHRPTTSRKTTQSTTATSTRRPTTSTTTTQSTTSTTTRQTTTTRSTTTQSTTTTNHYTSTTTATMIPASLGNTTLCPSSVVQYAQQDGEILTQMGDSCYTIVPHKVSWPHAEAVCNHRGGHLFHVGNQGENLFFYITLNTRFNHSVWMGLHDTVREEHFQWTSGDPLNYTNWVPGRKSNFASHNAEDCAVFVPYLNHGQWDDIPCGAFSPLFESLMEEHYFICQFPTRTAAPIVHQVSSGHTNLCPSRVKYYANLDGNHLAQYDKSCYERVSNRKTWNGAEQDCKSLGGHLVQIGSPQEEAFIQSFLSRVDSQHAVWIGLHDQGHEEYFTWTSGERLTYTNWISSRKNNFFSHSVEDCVTLIPYKQGQWDDIPCGGFVVQSSFGTLQQHLETHPYICEYRTTSSGPSIIIGK